MIFNDFHVNDSTFQLWKPLLKGAPPIAADPPAESRIWGFWDCSENVEFWIFVMGFGVWEGLQWIGNACGLQIDGFSAHIEPYGSIFNDFHDFGQFSMV